MPLEHHEKLILIALHRLNGKALRQDICKQVRLAMFPNKAKSVPRTAGHFAVTERFLGKLVQKELVQEHEGGTFSLTQAGRNEVAAGEILRS